MKEKISLFNQKNIIAAIFALLTTFVLTLNLDIISEEAISNTIITESRAVRFVTVLYLSSGDFSIQYLIVLVALYFFYRHSFYQRETVKRQKRISMILAVAFTLFLLIGNSYHKTQDAILLTYNHLQTGKIIIAFIGYVVLFYALVSEIYYRLDVIINQLQRNNLTSGKFIGLTNKILGRGRTAFIRSFFILWTAYLPYIIVTYPSCHMGDTRNQLHQIYGIIGYNDWHPICHTLFLAGCVKLGEVVFHSMNIGCFIYTLLQFFIMIFVLSYCIHRIVRSHFSFLGLPVLAFYCFTPFFAMYGALITKDSIWAPLVLLWNIEFLDILEKYKDGVSYMNLSRLFVVSILVCLFRKNGIYLFLLSVFSLIFVIQKQRKRIIVLFVCIVALFQLFSKICLPFFQVEAGSKREMFSIPFQQTARYVCTYPDEVTKEEKNAISKILDYDSLSNYIPTLADPVKGTFHEDATLEELTSYFHVWFQMFKKHPGTYISATVNNYYDYFYFSVTLLGYRMEWSQTNIELLNEELPCSQEVSHYYDSDFINELRNFIMEVQDMAGCLPGVSLLMTAAFYQWVMLIIIGYLIAQKYYRFLAAYIPILSILLVNLAGPTNGSYFRYEYPIAFCIPYVVIWTLHNIVCQENTGNRISQKNVT